MSAWQYAGARRRGKTVAAQLALRPLGITTIGVLLERVFRALCV